MFFLYKADKTDLMLSVFLERLMVINFIKKLRNHIEPCPFPILTGSHLQNLFLQSMCKYFVRTNNTFALNFLLTYTFLAPASLAA